MSKKTRRKFTKAFKTKVVLEALKERLTLSEIAEKYQIHSTQISTWKAEFLSNAEKAFGGEKDEKKALLAERDELHRQIGEMKVENDFLKKNLLL